MAKNNLKKNITGVLTVPNFKIYYRAIVSKHCYWCRGRQKISGTERKSQVIGPDIYTIRGFLLRVLR